MPEPTLSKSPRNSGTRVTTTVQVYGHLFPGVDARLDGLLEETRAGATQRLARHGDGTPVAMASGSPGRNRG
jgi:hypothetical protein